MILVLGAMAQEARDAAPWEELERLIGGIAGGSREDLAELYRRTRAAVYGLALSYLKIGDISKDMILQEYDVGSIVRQAVKKYSRLFILQKIGIRMEEIKQSVVTDEKWLLFVLEQLLSNALKYTKEGSISIYMKEKGILVIEDSGIGIAPEDLPRIMEKGFTGYNGRRDKKSTGLGLYLCRSILDKLNHQIRIESEVGKGTKVFLNLNREPLEVE